MITDWLNKPYHTMSDDELSVAHQHWTVMVEEASGWSSAHFSAKQLKKICAEGAKRQLKITNPYPIVVG